MVFKTAIVALLGAILLSGCTNVNSATDDSSAYSDGGSSAGYAEESAESVPLYSAENPGSGITGETLPSYNYFGRMNLPEGDVAMYVACQYMHAYETGVVVQEGEDVEPEAKVLKEHFRTLVIYNLGLISESYPEATIYQQGALEKLADDSLEPEGYVSFQRSCEPYLALLDRMDVIATEEVALFPRSCWSGPDIRHKLEIKLDGEWESLGQYRSTKQEDVCTDPEYPYAVTAEVQLYGQSWDFRWINLPEEQYDSFGDGSAKIIEYFTSDSTGSISNEKEVRK